jgi:hypothetical protein
MQRSSPDRVAVVAINLGEEGKCLSHKRGGDTITFVPSIYHRAELVGTDALGIVQRSVKHLGRGLVFEV